jgi:hypothetical protein
VTVTIQVVGALVTLAFVAVIVRMVRQRKLRAKYSFLWLIVGVVFVTTTSIPGLLGRLSNAVGIYYPPAFLFLGAIVFLLFLAVHISWELSRLEDRTRTLAEELALANEELRSIRNERAERAVTSTPDLRSRA